MEVNAPAVIIAPEHQSCPKTPPPLKVTDTRRFANSGEAVPIEQGETRLRDYDAEMDNPLTDPRDLADLQAFEERDPCKPTEQIIEEALKWYETNYQDQRMREQRWQGQQRWQGRENEEMRLVRILHPYSFLKKLSEAGIQATPEWAPQTGCTRARLWLNEHSRLGRIGVNAWCPDPEVDGKLKIKTVATLQYPYAPEWSIMRFDRYNVPTNERYHGWRTTLLCLIMENVLTEAEAHRAFGAPTGEASLFYRQQLYEHRRITLGLDKF